jgi:hypothetical protein
MQRGATMVAHWHELPPLETADSGFPPPAARRLHLARRLGGLNSMPQAFWKNSRSMSGCTQAARLLQSSRWLPIEHPQRSAKPPSRVARQST